MSTLFTKSSTFKLPHSNYRIFVLGTGGTGGFFIENAIRLVRAVNLSGEGVLELIAIDGDCVEDKNLLRQNFYPKDNGKNKAEVLATRFSKLFGIPIPAITKYIESEEELENILFDKPDFFPILVGCVDNHRTRQMIHNVYLNNPEKMVWIDSGNEEYVGEVVVGFNSNTKLTEDGTIGLFNLPAKTEVYPEIMERENEKFNSEVSCDDAAVENIQNISVNITGSTALFNIVNQLVTGEHQIKVHELRYASNVGSTEHKRITLERLNKYYRD